MGGREKKESRVTREKCVRASERGEKWDKETCFGKVPGLVVATLRLCARGVVGM